MAISTNRQSVITVHSDEEDWVYLSSSPINDKSNDNLTFSLVKLMWPGRPVAFVG